MTANVNFRADLRSDFEYLFDKRHNFYGNTDEEFINQFGWTEEWLLIKVTRTIVLNVLDDDFFKCVDSRPDINVCLELSTYTNELIETAFMIFLKHGLESTLAYVFDYFLDDDLNEDLESKRKALDLDLRNALNQRCKELIEEIRKDFLENDE